MDAAANTPARRGVWSSFSRVENIIEVTVFLLLIVPSMIISYLTVEQGGVSFVVLAYATIVRDLALVSLIVFFLWRNGETQDHVGWTARRWGTEVLIGLLLFIPLVIGAGLLEALLRRIGLSGPQAQATAMLLPNGAAEIVLAVVLVLVVALAEETIFRGYLILRLTGATRSIVAAVLLSAFFFSIGHGYQGSAGVVTIFVVGLYLALVYIWRRSLIAPIVMHFLQNFLAIVLAPVFLR